MIRLVDMVKVVRAYANTQGLETGARSYEQVVLRLLLEEIHNDRICLYNADVERLDQLYDHQLMAEVLFVGVQGDASARKSCLIPFGQELRRRHCLLMHGTLDGTKQGIADGYFGRVIDCPPAAGAVAALLIVAQDGEEFGSVLLASQELSPAQAITLLHDCWIERNGWFMTDPVPSVEAIH